MKGKAGESTVKPLRFTALGSESLAIVSLPAANHAAEALEWLATALPAARSAGGAQGGIAALTAGDGVGATAVVVPESALQAVPPPSGASVEQPWASLRVTLPLSPERSPSASDLAEIDATLSGVGVRWRILPGTASQILLVKEEDLPAATVALARHGHAIGPPARVCAPVPKEDETASTRNADYVGVWGLQMREEPIGVTVQEHAKGSVSGPMRLQAPSGLYVEVRIPKKADDESSQESCAGFHAVVDLGSERRLSVRHRVIDFRPPRGAVLCTQVKFDKEVTVMGELSTPRSRHRDEYVEAWTKVQNGPVTALELVSETFPSSSSSSSRPRAGYWLFLR